MRKIKTGRFDGQPDWMPDCKMVKDRSSIGLSFIIETGNGFYVRVHKTGIIQGYGKLERMEEHDCNIPYIYEPDPQPLDVVACWDDDLTYVQFYIWYDILSTNWENIVIVPDELKSTTDFSVGTWQKLKEEGKVEVIK